MLGIELDSGEGPYTQLAMPLPNAGQRRNTRAATAAPVISRRLLIMEHEHLWLDGRKNMSVREPKTEALDDSLRKWYLKPVRR